MNQNGKEHRLVFRRDEHLYNNIDEIKEKISGELGYVRNSVVRDPNHEELYPLFGEPMVFRYRNPNGNSATTLQDANIVLAIGSWGKDSKNLDGTQAHYSEYKYFIIDIGSIENDVRALSASTTEEISGLDIAYNSGDETVSLLDKNGTVISSFDASDFVKDGMIREVRLIENAQDKQQYDNRTDAGAAIPPYLLIIWNTPDSDPYLQPDQCVVTRISLSKLFNIYTAGDGLKQTSLEKSIEFAVKIDEAHNENHFLQVGPNGLRIQGIENAISSATEALEHRVDDKLSAEHNATQNQLDEINGKIGSGFTEHSVTYALQQEKSERNAAISQEATARQAAIEQEATNRQEAIQQERYERELKDDELENKLSGLTSDFDSAVYDINSDINELNDVAANINNRLINVENDIIDDVAPNDKLLSLNGHTISSSLSIIYNNDEGMIYFYGNKFPDSDERAIIGYIDVSDFIKDGMISNVEGPYERTSDGHTVIKINWNTDAGIQSQELDVSSLIKVYKIAEDSVDYLSINEDNEISIKVDKSGGLVSLDKFNEFKQETEANNRNLANAINQDITEIYDIIGSGILDEHGVVIPFSSKILNMESELNSLRGKTDVIESDLNDIENQIGNSYTKQEIDGMVSGLSADIQEEANTRAENDEQAISEAVNASKDYTDSRLGNITDIHGIDSTVEAAIESRIGTLLNEDGNPISVANAIGSITDDLGKVESVAAKFTDIEHKISDVNDKVDTVSSTTYNKTEIDLKLAEIAGGGDVDIVAKTSSAITVGGLPGGSLGNYSNGDLIPAGTEIETILRNILSKRFYPTSSNPSVSVSLINADRYQVGDTVVPEYRLVYTDGAYIDYQGNRINSHNGISSYTIWTNLDPDDKIVITGAGASTTGVLSAITVEDNMELKIYAYATYGRGDVPKTNLGEDYPAGTIPSGNTATVVSSSAITGYRPSYIGNSVLAKTEQEILTEEFITSLASSSMLYDRYTLINNAEQIIIAFPASSGYNHVSRLYDTVSYQELADYITMRSLTIDGMLYYVAICQPLSEISSSEFTISYDTI